MKNKFEIRGDHAVIFLRRQKDVPMEVLLDVSDLERAKEYPGTWGVDTYSYKDFTCSGTHCHKGEKTGRIYLHRWVLQLPDSEVVSFASSDSLDCRRDNLKIRSRVEAGREFWQRYLK